MKRSEVNKALKELETMCEKYHCYLPPFCHFTPQQWQTIGHEYDEVRDCMLGWDITDYGLNDFDKFGFSLITIRNGNRAMEDKYPKVYAEKLLYLKEGQYAPNHFHWYKTEDIINRGGGNVLIRVYNSLENEEIDYESDVTVHTDGRTYTVPAGTQIRLTPGESIHVQQFHYSASVARTVKTVMNISMRFALDKKIISENPAKDVKLPKYIKKKNSGTRNIDSRKTLNVEQIMVLLEASRDTPIHMQVLLNVLMGLRRQEINGVKYSDIDYINRTLNLERQLGQKINTRKEDFEPKTFTKQEVKLKTYSSQRVLPIPDYVFEAILEQREIYEENSRKRKNFRDLDYICCSKDGMPRSKSYHWKLYKQLLKDNNLPDIRWHDLRSTFCTLLLKNDFSPKAVSKLMGHAKEIITIDVYADKKMIIADCIDELQPYIDDVLPDDEEIDTMDVACQVDVTEYLEQVAAPMLEGWMATGELLAI